MRARPCLLLSVLILAVVAPAGAGETHWDYRLVAAVGQDSNPLRISGDGPGGSFTELRAGTLLTREVGARLEWFVDADVRRRFYSGSRSDAGYGSADLRAGVGVSPGNGRVVLALGGLYELRRSTYTDRLDGEPYRVAADPATSPGETVGIPDRFDFDSTGVFLDARMRLTRRVKLFLDGTWSRARFDDSDLGRTTLEPLDYRSLSVEPGFTFRVNDLLSLALGLEMTDIDYEDLTAVDESGDEMTGSRRSDRYAGYNLTVRLEPGYRWDLRIGLRGSSRDDTNAGYYDSSGVSTYLSARRALNARSHLRFHASVRNLDYDRATVGDGPDGEPRNSDVRRLLARYERKFAYRLSWFAETGTQRTDNADPEFAYDRDWLLTGITFER